MSVPTMDELASLIGQPLDDPTVQAFLAEYGPKRRRPLPGVYDPEQTLADTAAGYEIVYQKVRRKKSERVVVAYLYVEPQDGFGAFAGSLSGGLAAADGPVEVSRKLGPANRWGLSDGAGEWLWERRDSDHLFLHIAYGRGRVGIRLVTLLVGHHY